MCRQVHSRVRRAHCELRAHTVTRQDQPRMYCGRVLLRAKDDLKAFGGLDDIGKFLYVK